MVLPAPRERDRHTFFEAVLAATDEGITAFERALALAPADPRAQLGIARSLTSLERHQEAQPEWRALIEREHGRTVISYDPNLRFNVEPDRAKWRDMLAFMLPRTHLLKISDEDLGLLMPDATPEAFAAEALAAGVNLVVDGGFTKRVDF